MKRAPDPNEADKRRQADLDERTKAAVSTKVKTLLADNTFSPFALTVMVDHINSMVIVIASCTRPLRPDEVIQ